MADVKITDLLELAAVPDGDDVLPIVDLDAAPATTKKIKVSNLVGVPNTSVTALLLANFTGPGFVLITGMTITPAAGNYLVLYSGNHEQNTNTGQHDIVIFVDGVPQLHSFRSRLNGGATFNGIALPMSTQAVVTVDGAQPIEARVDPVAGDVDISQRSMTIIKVL